MEFQGEIKANILERHLKFMKIQLTHITCCKTQTLLVVVTHCNAFTNLTFECFYFLIGTFAWEADDPQNHFLFMILYSKQ